jgi:hypothetical protein
MLRWVESDREEGRRMTDRKHREAHRLGPDCRVLFPALMFLLALGAAPAGTATYAVTNNECSGPGSLYQAVADANADDTADTIQIGVPTLGFIDPCPIDRSSGELGDQSTIRVTGPVVIKGNGVEIFGEVSWISGEDINPLRCPDPVANPDDFILAYTGFLTVGNQGPSNAGTNVIVRNATLRGLNHIAVIHDGASLTLEDVQASDIYNIHDCQRGGGEAIRAYPNALLTLRRNEWNDVYVLTANAGEPLTTIGTIADFSWAVGDLTIENSQFASGNPEQMFISWAGLAGTEVNVVSSRMEEVGGISSLGAHTTNIVNSLWAANSLGAAGSRFLHRSTGAMNFTNSTLLFTTIAPAGVLAIGGLWADGSANAGPIGLYGTAIGAFTFAEGLVLDDGEGGSFAADDHTWIQPVPAQDAAALMLVTGQSSLKTGVGLPEDLATGESPEARATPLPGGELIDAIPDTCGPDGASTTLLNPVDGSAIPTDVLGNPRCHELGASDFRNIGAVANDRMPDRSERATSGANNPRYWENLGYGDCTKDEQDDDFGPVWALDAPATALILKSGRTNDVWVALGPGAYGTAAGKDISHVIVCVG